MIGKTLLHYEVTARIGAGGMGEVYRATDTKLGREVAIKVLPAEVAGSEERTARFEREARVLAALNHPGIASIYGLEEADGHPFLVMELAPGEDLKQRLVRGRIPVGEVVEIARQIAEALEAAHEKGVVHRDLKPGNVMLTPDGKVKVLDFGLAKAFEPESDDPDASVSPTLTARATQAGVILGSAAYMAPEQARGKPVDRRADIWAFGVVLFEMLTGRRVFEGDDVSMTLAEVLKGEPEWSALPGATPAAVVGLLRRCLTRDPWRRLRDIGEARVLLEAPEAVPRVDVAGEPMRTGTRTWLPWLLVAVAVAGSFLLGRAQREVGGGGRVLRNSMPLPFLTFQAVLSPDGRHLAVQAVDEQRRTTQVLVRALDSWEFRPLPGTEGVSTLFWSADGESIAFVARGELRRVSVEGGPGEKICDLPGLLGATGSWGSAGDIILAPSYKYAPGPLHRVPAAGGEVVALTRTVPGESHRYPEFLPDGRHFLFTKVGGEAAGIYLGSLEGEERRLLRDPSATRLSAPPEGHGQAHLLFVRDERLMAQPFDLTRRSLQGEPFPLLARVPYADDGSLGLSFSSDGSMAYLAGRSRDFDSRFTWFDRTGRRLDDVGPAGPASPVSISPGGDMLARGERPPARYAVDVYLRDLTRGVDERLTFDTQVDVASNVVWSPDGRRVVFSGGPPGVFDLLLKDVGVADPAEPLLESPYPKYPTAWSSDGDLFYSEHHPETQADIWYLPLAEDGSRAGEPVVLVRTAFLESGAQPSPDGHWVAYVSNESGSTEVYVVDFPSGRRRRKVSSGTAIEPRWSPDGRELFFLVGEYPTSSLVSVSVGRREGAGVGSEELVLGDPVRLFDVSANAFHPATGTLFYQPSSDGQRFLVNHIDSSAGQRVHVVTNWRHAF